MSKNVLVPAADEEAIEKKKKKKKKNNVSLSFTETSLFDLANVNFAYYTTFMKPPWIGYCFANAQLEHQFS